MVIYIENSLGKNAIILTLVKIITVFSSLIVIMFLSRATTLEEYGTYNQIILMVTLFTSLLMLGLPNSINYFLARVENEDERNTFLFTYYSISTLLGLLIGICLVISSSYIESFFNNASISNYLFVLLLLPWTKVMNSSIENVLIVTGRVNKLQVFKLIHSLSIIIVAALSYIFDFNLTLFFLFYLIVEIIFSLVVYVFIFQITQSFRVLFEYSLIKKIFTFSIPIGLASIVGTINIQLDKLIVGRHFNTETLAIYFNASKEIPLNVLAVSLTALIMPKIVRYLKNNHSDKAIQLWRHSIIISFYLIAFFVMIFFIFPEEILVFLYSEKYAAGSDVFRLYSLALILRVTYFGMILNSLGKTRIVLYSSLIAVLVNLILNIVLIRSIGIEGPAVATIISMMIMALFQLRMSSRAIKISLKDIFPWVNLLKITAIVLSLGSIGVILKELITFDFLIGSIMEYILITIGLAITYIFIVKNDFIKNWKLMNSE